MNGPPTHHLTQEDFENSTLLHERLVDLFGACLTWCRDDAVKCVQSLLADGGKRAELATANRTLFEHAASLLRDDADLSAAQTLQNLSTKEFAANLMTLLSGMGSSLPVSPQYVARFRLTVELCDRNSNEIVHEEVINRGGKKFFADYLNRWLNR
jgi:hypothetical protein